MTIYEIIESIAATSSTNEKKAILERNKDNEVLKQVFFFAYNPRFNFWIGPSTEVNVASSGIDVNLATLDSLYALIERKVTGNEARAYFTDLLKPLTMEARDILCRVLNHDLRCGASDTIASKVWKNLVPEYPVMLCGKYNEKTAKYLKKFENNVGFVVQKKSDGGRICVSVDFDGNVSYKSRSGNELNLFKLFDTDFSRFPGSVFDGELIIRTAEGKPDRKASNGIYTKAVRGTISKEEAAKFNIELWDMIPLNEFNAGVGTEGYEARLIKLLNIKFSPYVSIVESQKCATLEECFKFYNRMREIGEEGAIIKVADSVWSDGRSKNAIKLKAEESADLLCIGVEEGSGKYAGMIGNLVCVTSCGKLKVNPGTGLKDEDRARDPSYFIGKIVEIAYNEVIKARDRDTFSLFLPVYKQVRLDKKVANSLEELA